MKVRVNYTIDLSEFQCRAIGHHYGDDIADRETIRTFLIGNGSGALGDAELDYSEYLVDTENE